MVNSKVLVGFQGGADAGGMFYFTGRDTRSEPDMMREKETILAIDDDASILYLLKRSLEAEFYQVLVAGDGRTGLDVFERENPNLILLDITMPEMDGYTVCTRVREISQVPIIIITARGQEDDKVKGFECGADDYLTKPFSVRELKARVKSVLRRSQVSEVQASETVFTSGDLEIDFTKRSVTIAGNAVNLTPIEYKLLREFVLNRGKAITHSYLLQKVWGPEYLNETEYLHVFIGRLRNKLHIDNRGQKYVMTLPGVGYQFQEGPSIQN
jgi:DNA-binding response OmpR family regulator